MTLAAFMLGTIIALLIGCAFHFWKGGGIKWLMIYNLFSIFGFWLGHIIGKLLKVEILMLGPTYLGFALVVCLAVLFGGYWLSMASIENSSDKKNQTK